MRTKVRALVHKDIDVATPLPGLDEPEILYGCQAIADMLKVTRRQAFHMIETGLPTFRIGRTVCARPAAVREWLAQQEAATLVRK